MLPTNGIQHLTMLKLGLLLLIYLEILTSFVKGEAPPEDDLCVSDTEERPPDFNMTFASNYDNSMPPKEAGTPDKVMIRICPWKIGEISFSRMTIEIDVYLKIYWKDFRVNVTASIPETTDVIMTKEETDRLWMPLLAFRNAMGDDPLTQKPGIGGLRWSEGSFLTLVRKTDKFHCDFDLHYYPLDTQDCLIEVQALNYKSSLDLVSLPCEMSGLMSGSSPPSFRFVDFYHGDCTRADKLSELYPCVQYGLILKRQIAFHLATTYLPSMLIVTFSFVSFWLEVTNAAPRVVLGVTALLTLTTQFVSVQKDMPPVSYMKAIDVWMFACITIVFGGLIEFAFANFFDRMISKKTALIQPSAFQKKLNKDGGPGSAFTVSYPKPPENKKKDSYIDRVSRVAFPLVFVSFGFIYWSFIGTR